MRLRCGRLRSAKYSGQHCFNSLVVLAGRCSGRARGECRASGYEPRLARDPIEGALRLSRRDDPPGPMACAGVCRSMTMTRSTASGMREASASATRPPHEWPITRDSPEVERSADLVEVPHVAIEVPALGRRWRARSTAARLRSPACSAEPIGAAKSNVRSREVGRQATGRPRSRGAAARCRPPPTPPRRPLRQLEAGSRAGRSVGRRVDRSSAASRSTRPHCGTVAMPDAGAPIFARSATLAA